MKEDSISKTPNKESNQKHNQHQADSVSDSIAKKELGVKGELLKEKSKGSDPAKKELGVKGELLKEKSKGSDPAKKELGVKGELLKEKSKGSDPAKKELGVKGELLKEKSKGSDPAKKELGVKGELLKEKSKGSDPGKEEVAVQGLEPSAKQVLGEAAEQWLARNRSLVLRQTPFWAQSLAGILIGLGSLAVLGGVLFKIDEVVTVRGQLQAISGSTDVKSPAGGKVAAVFYKDGQLVDKGQLLVRFDTREATDQKIMLTRLIELENRDLQSAIGLLNQQKAVVQQKVNTNQKIADEMKELVKEGAFQRVRYLQQLDELYALKSQLSNTQLEINLKKIQAEKSIGQMQNQLTRANLTLQYQNVVAPVTGVVFDPKASEDGVLQSGETILTLVPQEGLKAQVFVPNKDIGFVKIGQKAKVRVDAFPYSRYGELDGQVAQIGADALPPDETFTFYRFPVKLTLDRSFLESRGVTIPLRSGMSITTNLKLREKRLISLISDLLVDNTESIKSLRQQ